MLISPSSHTNTHTHITHAFRTRVRKSIETLINIGADPNQNLLRALLKGQRMSSTSYISLLGLWPHTHKLPQAEALKQGDTYMPINKLISAYSTKGTPLKYMEAPVSPTFLQGHCTFILHKCCSFSTLNKQF